MASLVRDVPEMQRMSEALRSSGRRVAVVPTMGSLHEGHLSLIRIARKQADAVITTVFVNPTQFGPSEDFTGYPRDLGRDTALASTAGTDYLFAPPTEAMYPQGYRSFVQVDGLGDILEGESRPGHFRGVATVVTKLFNITRPHAAVFGQKDAQQVAVIRRMTDDLNFSVQIIVGPIVREPDGLAMSSRNFYLLPEQRREAPVLYRSLQLAEQHIQSGLTDAGRIIAGMRDLITTQSSGVVDYISIADQATLQKAERIEPGRPVLVSLAVKLGGTRLIDNCIVSKER